MTFRPSTRVAFVLGAASLAGASVLALLSPTLERAARLSAEQRSEARAVVLGAVASALSIAAVFALTASSSRRAGSSAWCAIPLAVAAPTNLLVAPLLTGTLINLASHIFYRGTALASPWIDPSKFQLYLPGVISYLVVVLVLRALAQRRVGAA